MANATPDSSLVELTIERPVAGGRMMARLDGRVVFVAGALPGERVRAFDHASQWKGRLG